MNSVIQVFILAILPFYSCFLFYAIIHKETNSKAITIVENVLCGLAFVSIYIIELACIL